jgi:nicotinate-nucleotide adenylyltransferase
MVLAQAARDACGLDEVWFLVNPDPLHKLAVADFANRRAMVGLAVAGRPGFRSDALPPGMVELPHTWVGFQQIFAGFPQSQFKFIVGMDTLLRLDRWEDLESVVNSTAYIVAHRPGTSVDGLSQLRRRLGPLGDDLKVELVDLPTLTDASSTRVRQLLAKGERISELDDGVFRYIAERGLYRS